MVALRLLLAIASALVPGNGTQPRKLPIPLADIVDDAAIICIGHVDQVFEADVSGIEWPERDPDDDSEVVVIGRIVVERVLEGPSDLEVVYHEAWSTWTCDTTHAKVGERAIYLLGTDGELATAPAGVRNAVAAAVGNQTIYRNLYSGDGIARIQGHGGAAIVHCAGVPRVLWTEEREHVPLDGVVRYIEELVEFGRDEAVVHLYARPGSGYVDEAQWFDARILADGRCRLAMPLGDEERVWRFRLECAPWESLQARLSSLVGSTDRSLGDPRRGFWPARSLHVRTQGGSLTYVEPSVADEAWFAALDATALRDVVTAWEAVFRELDCVTCYDYTLADRELLRER